MGVSSSLPEEAVSTSSLSLPEYHRQYQELLQRVAAELEVPLEEVSDRQCRLLDILQPSGPSTVAFSVNKALTGNVPGQYDISQPSVLPYQKWLKIGTLYQLKEQSSIYPPSAQLLGGAGSQRKIQIASLQGSSVRQGH